MPWTVDNPPLPAKNWSSARKHKCVRAANNALSLGKSEEEAIFACIGAAKVKEKTRVSDTQVEIYEEVREETKKRFERFAVDWLNDRDYNSFKKKMQDELKSFYIRTALIAKGEEELTDSDRLDISRFLANVYEYLDGFIEDLKEYKKALATDQGVISRTSSYGLGWGVFSRFSIPEELARVLPHLPGISCLGNGDCGCILEWDVSEDGVEVYWLVNPFKQHCIICADLGIDWNPLVIPIEELEGF